MSSLPVNYIRASILLCFLGYSATSYSTTSTSTFGVSATVVNDCSIVAAGTMAFPNYVLTSGSDTTQTSTITVTCNSGAIFNMGLNAGTGSGATVTTRKMTRTGGGAQTLNYSLYSDSAWTTVWGNTIGTDTVASSGLGSQQNFTVYGKIPAAQAVPAASYADTITLTVTY